MTDDPQAETTLVEGPQTVSHNANELRRKLATAERIRENADFHLGQEMARRQLAEQETARLRAVVARLRQMTDHWEKQLPEVIRTPAVVSAIRAALEPADGPSRMADEAQQPVAGDDDAQFGSPDCTCVPWTREGGTARYCQPGDTVDQISGWERGGDCPHHRTAAVSQPSKEARS